jgi:cation transport ATPase
LVPKERIEEVSFTIQTIDCIACSPIFRRALLKVEGVVEVRELLMTNRIVVVFDGSRLGRQAMVNEIRRTSQKAGFGGKIIFHR